MQEIYALHSRAAAFGVVVAARMLGRIKTCLHLDWYTRAARP